MKRIAFCLTLIIVALYSCTSGVSRKSQDGADTLRLSYSRLLNIVEHEGYNVVEIANPWKKGEVLHRYVLVSNPDCPHLPEGTIINVPVKNAAAFTTVHASLMQDLRIKERISGIADVEYVKRLDT